MILTAYGVLVTPYPRYQIKISLHRLSGGYCQYGSKEAFQESGDLKSHDGYQGSRIKTEKPDKPAN